MGPICLVDIELGLYRQLTFAGFANGSYYISMCGKYTFMVTAASTLPKLHVPPSALFTSNVLSLKNNALIRTLPKWTRRKKVLQINSVALVHKIHRYSAPLKLFVIHRSATGRIN